MLAIRAMRGINSRPKNSVNRVPCAKEVLFIMAAWLQAILVGTRGAQRITLKSQTTVWWGGGSWVNTLPPQA